MSSQKIRLDGKEIVCQQGESVLDALLREHIDIPHACREGACQSCMIRGLEGAVPAAAQQGLKDVLRHQNYFLACICYPHQDISISLGSAPDAFNQATVTGKQLLNPETLLLSLQCQEPMDFYAGQFVNLKRADGLTRSYSIANNRVHAHKLTFHIRRLAGGRFSEWAHRELNIGDSIAVSDPQGLCYYLPNTPEQNMLLIGTGSGLAPLAGIVEEALHHGHAGQIHLYHGSREMDGLYWIEEMRELANRHPNFHCTACVSRGDAPAGIAQGRANDLAMSAIPSLKGWRVYLCGHPDMVNHGKRQAYLHGAGLQDIYSDAFHVASATLD
ncbi:2Fe-2S iron-sulfur cluster binding domain-containing protein [Methylomonas sp. LL1]|uniref:2Fe-2S iron-sulfur cluster-binding protein n=1 Tax=Methylomonas sp. LL1 TaxID=2785785 RepID=UPI0018C368FA|nr:2Fe-2S iron-sulfur cluster-binding protein [Methylomonas sp. LL1]QPK63346.1 2Fe-2S iron-sulfur cluster binding domain-containing protein [Methylomonas sp. LL1]